MEKPVINDLVGLLDQFAKPVLHELRVEFPNETRLQPTVTLGRSDSALTKADAKACVAALQVAIKLCDSGITEAWKKIQSARRINLGGQIATLIAASSLLALIAKDASKAAQYAAAILALLGGIANLISDFVHAAADGSGATTSFGTLVTIRHKAERLLNHLQNRLYRWKRDDESLSEIQASIETANQLSGDVYRMCRSIGVKPLSDSATGEVTHSLAEMMPAHDLEFLNRNLPQ